jgi:hypothetical protein
MIRSTSDLTRDNFEPRVRAVVLKAARAGSLMPGSPYLGLSVEEIAALPVPEPWGFRPASIAPRPAA